CLSDLALTPATAIGNETDPAKVVKAFFQQRSCVSLARFQNALGGDADRYTLRLLQQWIGVHRFIANQAILRALGDRVLAANDYSRDLSVPLALDQPQTILDGNLTPQTFGPALDVLDRGLAVLLDWQVTQPLNAVPGALIADADYRKDAGVSDTTPAREQAEGLPVSLLSGLTAYLSALDFHGERINAATYDACPNDDLHARRSKA